VGPRLSVNKPELKALFQKVGGESGLSEILKDFYQRMADDLLIGFFFTGKDLEKIASQQLKFLMRAMGASPSYSGKSPAQAHLELPPILAGHFDRRLRILEATLRDHHLTEREIQVWIQFETTFRPSVQHTP
jgi:hemoglobin